MKHFILISFVLLLFASCKEENMEKIKVFVKENDLPVEDGSNVEINYTDSGHVKARVFAPVLQRYENEIKSQTKMPKGITVYFYGKGKKINSYLKAKYAIRDSRLRVMTVRNDVFVVNVNGDTLKTEELIWDEATNKISTQKFVSVKQTDRIIYSDGLETNTDFSNYKFFNIKGVLSLKQ